MADRCRTLEVALDTLSDVFYIYDADGRLTYWNTRLNDLFGLTDDELAGMGPTDFFVEADRPAVEAAVEEVFESGETTVEARAETTEGPVRFELSGHLLTDDGEMLGFSGTGRDVTERHEQEWHLQRQNDRLTEFADLLAHDLRTPLAVTSGHLELAAQATSSDHIDAAKSGLERLEAIIEDMRTATREGTLATDETTLDIADVAAAAWDHVDTDVATLEQPPSILVTGEEKRLLRLLENVFANAVTHGLPSDDDATNEGRIPLTVRVASTTEGFAIEDDGQGIAPSDREWVFEPGASRAANGTGFGLYIVRAIAEAHGWAVRVTDGETDGARFEFDISADSN